MQYYASHHHTQVLSVPKALSWTDGFFYLSDKSKTPNEAPSPNNPVPTDNRAINVTSSIMREVLASATEAALARLFHDSKEACPMKIAAEEMDTCNCQPQLSPIIPPQWESPMKTSNKNDRRPSTCDSIG
mmetsp:Transcript_17363/g.25072  ORF Transcript_17363/g.25072 Transcript_17363/m.25072 type:complete len:130 (+) Transcript_17363:1450-1839(+)